MDQDDEVIEISSGVSEQGFHKDLPEEAPLNKDKRNRSDLRGVDKESPSQDWHRQASLADIQVAVRNAT